jgi:hypothetical protein
MMNEEKFEYQSEKFHVLFTSHSGGHSDALHGRESQTAQKYATFIAFYISLFAY